MHIEIRHLRTIQAIHEAGGLARAAERMNLTQSALSHQIKGLEEQVGMELFVRRSKPLRLSAAGFRLLSLAQKILPEIAATEDEFSGLHDGRQGRLHIALECHACYQWLLPLLDEFRKIWPEIDLDIRPGLAFEAMAALHRGEVDLVITSDPEDMAGVQFQPLFDYSPVFVAASDHPLARKPFIEAEDFRTETLLTYPVETARLDVFNVLLHDAGVEPAKIRQIELTEVILLLVASGRGVTVLPDWVLRHLRYSPDYVARPLTENGITKRIYAAVRDPDISQPFMAHFVRQARMKPVQYQRPTAK